MEEFVKWCPVDPYKSSFAPYRHYESDAGYDLTCTQQTMIGPGEFRLIPTNVRVALPDGHWCMLVARSSTSRRGLMVLGGIIDGGWRGELFATIYNGSGRTVKIEEGERLVQMIIFKLITPGVVKVGELPKGDRGENGFGSTGK